MMFLYMYKSTSVPRIKEEIMLNLDLLSNMYTYISLLFGKLLLSNGFLLQNLHLNDFTHVLFKNYIFKNYAMMLSL